MKLKKLRFELDFFFINIKIKIRIKKELKHLRSSSLTSDLDRIQSNRKDNPIKVKEIRGNNDQFIRQWENNFFS
jgi:hypothetical protein